MPIISGFPAGGNAKFPEGGKTDQVLVKTEEGEAWGNVKTVAEKATQKPISFQVTGLEGEEFTIEFTEDGEGGSSGVESFNGRSGAIVPQAGDYTAEMVGAIPITRTVNGKPLSADITLVAADVGARSNTWIPTAAQAGDYTAEMVGAIPITRTVNGKPLSADITLVAADVGARSNTWIPTAAETGSIPATEKGKPSGVAALDESGKIPSTQLPDMNYDPSGSASTVQGNLDTHIANKANPHAVTAEQIGAVPSSRTVNGKPLSSNISLSAADVGARSNTWIPTAANVGALPITGGTLTGNLRIKNSSNSGMKLNFGAADVGARSNTWIPTAANVGALPITGGTLTGNLRIKNSSNSGMKLNFGDSEYVYLHESSDDNLDIKAKTINFLCTNLRQNGSDIGGSGNVVVGTYVGSCSDGQTQSINLGFRPKIVIIYHGGELLPWYRSEFEDYDDVKYGDLRRDEQIWHSDGAFIMDGFPIETKNGNAANNEDVIMVVGEITSSGFTVGQAYYNRNESTSRVDYYWKRYCDLATSGSTYAYIAFK